MSGELLVDPALQTDEDMRYNPAHPSHSVIPTWACSRRRPWRPTRPITPWACRSGLRSRPPRPGRPDVPAGRSPPAAIPGAPVGSAPQRPYPAVPAVLDDPVAGSRAGSLRIPLAGHVYLPLADGLVRFQCAFHAPLTHRSCSPATQLTLSLSATGPAKAIGASQATVAVDFTGVGRHDGLRASAAVRRAATSGMATRGCRRAAAGCMAQAEADWNTLVLDWYILPTTRAGERQLCPDLRVPPRVGRPTRPRAGVPADGRLRRGRRSDIPDAIKRHEVFDPLATGRRVTSRRARPDPVPDRRHDAGRRTASHPTRSRSPKWRNWRSTSSTSSPKATSTPRPRRRSPGPARDQRGPARTIQVANDRRLGRRDRAGGRRAARAAGRDDGLPGWRRCLPVPVVEERSAPLSGLRPLQRQSRRRRATTPTTSQCDSAVDRRPTVATNRANAQYNTVQRVAVDAMARSRRDLSLATARGGPPMLTVADIEGKRSPRSPSCSPPRRPGRSGRSRGRPRRAARSARCSPTPRFQPVENGYLGRDRPRAERRGRPRAVRRCRPAGPGRRRAKLTVCEVELSLETRPGGFSVSLSLLDVAVVLRVDAVDPAAADAGHVRARPGGDPLDVAARRASRCGSRPSGPSRSSSTAVQPCRAA